MDSFEYRNNRLYGEDVVLSQVAEQYGTPTYVYSRETLERHYLAYANQKGDLYLPPVESAQSQTSD